MKFVLLQVFGHWWNIFCTFVIFCQRWKHSQKNYQGNYRNHLKCTEGYSYTDCFELLWNLPNCIGALDRKHIRIENFHTQVLKISTISTSTLQYLWHAVTQMAFSPLLNQVLLDVTMTEEFLKHVQWTNGWPMEVLTSLHPPHYNWWK